VEPSDSENSGSESDVS